MIAITALIAILALLCVNEVLGKDLNSALPRFTCYPTRQRNCNKEFIEAYPHLSKSVTNLTDADTWFLLYTRKNKDKPELLHKCGGDLPPRSKFNPKNRLIVILTPFLAGYCDSAIYREWTTQFLIREDVNVMAMDWSWGNRWDYATAILNLKIAAEQVVIVLQNIQKSTGISKDKIYLIGHSLGAQMAGIIGNKFPVARITGIDPAGPGFAEKETPEEGRLDRSDADLVDIWHTNGGECLPNLGINYDAGHVDYYINGGQFQASCYPYALTSFLKGDFLYALGTALMPTACSHAHAAQYYKVSINPGNCQFVGVKCRRCQSVRQGARRSCGRTGGDCIIMGYDLDKFYTNTGTPQSYFVDTSMTCPWCDNSNIRLQGFEGTYKASLQSSRK